MYEFQVTTTPVTPPTTLDTAEPETLVATTATKRRHNTFDCMIALRLLRACLACLNYVFDELLYPANLSGIYTKPATIDLLINDVGYNEMQLRLPVIT